VLLDLQCCPCSAMHCRLTLNLHASLLQWNLQHSSLSHCLFHFSTHHPLCRCTPMCCLTCRAVLDSAGPESQQAHRASLQEHDPGHVSEAAVTHVASCMRMLVHVAVMC
jgi:hypothetical protein